MLAVIEGLPGAGKSTTLRLLGESNGVHIIDEIIGDEPSNASEEFYFQNDLRKQQLIIPDRINFMDRNFVSTLCYNYCSDDVFKTSSFEYISGLIFGALQKQQLRHPDMYFVLSCSTLTSLRRQDTSNSAAWLTPQFLSSAQAFYHDYFSRVKVPVTLIDTDKLSAHQVVNLISDALPNIAPSSSSDKGKRLQYA